jgi:signal transduction histidine kinase
VPPFTRTVRFRLTVWYSSLLLVFGIAFVVALNLAARLDRPDLFVVRGVRGNDIILQPLREVPGGAINGFPPGMTLEDAEQQIYSRNIERLRNWSLVAVVGLAAASGVGGYILSGMMLRPIRDITEVASEIGETNLSRRINHQGPDDELKALADTFDSMITRLEQSFDRQRQFVQDASHELRTPLAAIRTNIEVAEMDPDIGPDDYRTLLETVKTQTERLTRLSEDLLLLSTNEPGERETEAIGVGALYREVSRQLGPLASTRKVTLLTEAPDDLAVEAEGDLLYRCVFNLVDNAIKYSGEGSSVMMSGFRSNGAIDLTIRDNGPGIAPEDRERIFDRFTRLDKSRSRRQGGTGLGLAIVRELATTMRGSVDVESTPGQGSTFVLHLPPAGSLGEGTAKNGTL